MFKTTCISPPPSVGAAAERDERIHDQVGELSDVFCSPRFTGKIKLSRRSVPGAKRACRDVRGAYGDYVRVLVEPGGLQGVVS